MNGVEVLNVTMGYNNYVAMIVTSILISLLFGKICGMLFEISNLKILIVIYLISFISWFSGFYFSPQNLFKSNTQYQVTISDNVKFNEFNNKYKIISQDGKIYTVEERK